MRSAIVGLGAAFVLVITVMVMSMINISTYHKLKIEIAENESMYQSAIIITETDNIKDDDGLKAIFSELASKFLE